MVLTYSLCILFALAPSIVWLLFFLRKDSHPESNRMILIVFLLGMLVAIPAALIEAGGFRLLQNLSLPPILFSILSIFLLVALVEEVSKYLVVKVKVLDHPEFDEPVDTMLYMIIAALGFGAVENILILSPISGGSLQFQFFETLTISSFRFVGATFLHALSSATLGYFLAISFRKSAEKLKLLTFGFLLAIFLHGLYNFSIMKIEGSMRFLLPIIILIGLAIFVSLGFKRLKKLTSVCKIK